MWGSSLTWREGSKGLGAEGPFLGHILVKIDLSLGKQVEASRAGEGDLGNPCGALVAASAGCLLVRTPPTSPLPSEGGCSRSSVGGWPVVWAATSPARASRWLGSSQALLSCVAGPPGGRVGSVSSRGTLGAGFQQGPICGVHL